MSRDRCADEDAICGLIDRQVKAWEASDPVAYAGVFSPDADYVTYSGGHHAGRAAIAGSYVKLFRTILRDSRLNLDNIRLRFIAPDVALVHSQYTVVKGRRRLNSGVNTTVAVHTDEGWLFAASQNTKHRRLAERFLRMLDSHPLRRR